MIVLWLYRKLRARRAASSNGSVRASALPSGSRGTGRLVAHQLRYNVLAFLRNRQARFSTLILPVLFLVVFAGVFGNHIIGHTKVRASTYYVPGIAALGVFGASFANLVIAITTQRETGVLKRRRATPVPATVIIVSQAMAAMLVSLAVVAVVIILGKSAYGVTLHASTLPAVALTALVGSVAFACLSYALSTVIRSVDAATPTVQAISLPLYFISGIFVPNIELPRWLRDVARLLPLEPFTDGMHRAFDPTLHGLAVPWVDLALLTGWAMVGLWLARRRFTWAPSMAHE